MELFYKDIIELTKTCKAELRIGYYGGSDVKIISLAEGTVLQVSPFSRDLKDEITFRAVSPTPEEFENEFIDKSDPKYAGYTIDIYKSDLKSNFIIREKFDVANIDMTKRENHYIFLHLFFENSVPSHISYDKSMIEEFNKIQEDYDTGMITNSELLNQHLDCIDKYFTL